MKPSAHQAPLLKTFGWVGIFDHAEVLRWRGPEWWESGVELGVIGATNLSRTHKAKPQDQNLMNEDLLSIEIVFVEY